MVTYVTPRRLGRRWNARIRSNSTFAFATQQNDVRVGFWCQLKERLNREVGDVSRASLRLGRWAADGRKFQNLAKLLAKLPQTVRGAGRTDRRTQLTMRTRSMRKVRILDQLPPEVLSLVLSQLLPQDMMVQKCSRRWRDKDLDVLYWKQLFLNTFGEAAQTTKRTRKAAKARSREWRDRYERAWMFRVQPRTGALGLRIGRALSSYPHRVVPTRIYHAIDGQGVLSVPDVRGEERELRYYIHEEAIDVGAFEVDVDTWLYAPHEEDSDINDLLRGLVIYCPLGILYDPARPAVGRRGIRVGSPLRHLLEAYEVGLEDVEPYGDSRCGSQFGLRSVNIIQFGLADSDEYTLWDQWEELLEGTARVFDIDEGAWTGEVVVPRETLLNWPIQSLQIWAEDAF